MRETPFKSALSQTTASIWTILPQYWVGIAGFALAWLIIEAFVIYGNRLGPLWWWFWHIVPLYLFSFPEMYLFQVGLDASSGRKGFPLAAFLNFRMAFQWVGAQVVYLVFVCVGLLFFVIPGLVIAIRWQLAPYRLLDGRVSIREAFRDSFRLTRGIGFHLFLFDLFLVLINALGAAALGAGLLLTVPFSFLALAWLYRVRIEDVSIGP